MQNTTASSHLSELPTLPPTAFPEAALRDQLHERRRRLHAIEHGSRHAEVAALLVDIDSALDRLNQHEFGSCEVCHDPVEPDRVLANPLATVCLGCLSPDEIRNLENDLETAARVQSALLPEVPADLSGWDVDYLYRPLGVVSGDHYDFVPADDGTGGLYFFCGDVSGKGVAASMLMAHLQALLRSLVAQRLPLPEILTRANRLFGDTTPANAYVTLVAGRIEPSGHLEIGNAGHCPPVLAKDGAVEMIQADDMPLGLFPSLRFETRHLHLQEGDLLFLYTDGLSEALDPAGNEYGTERLGDAILEACPATARAAIELGARSLSSFRRSAAAGDDLTLMALRRTT